jgi:pimeloyl-ACP methyl ester carboxylesterase
MAKRILYTVFGLVAALLISVAGLTAYFWTPDTDPALMKQRYALPQSEFINPGQYNKARINLTFHATDRGPLDAPVLILLHGSNASLHTWEPTIRALGARLRVITIDLPGHGLTGPMPDGDYRMETLVQALDDFIAHKVLNQAQIRMGLVRPTDPPRFFLAGSSMGGMLAWRYALKYPEKILGLTLISPSGAPQAANAPKPELPLGFKLARMPGINILASHITPRALVARSLEQSVANPAITPALVDRYWELLRYPGNRQATLDRFATPNALATPAMLARLEMPTLIIWGREDKLIPVANAQFFKQHIPNSRLAIYDKVGHLPMEEVPQRLARDLLILYYDVEMGP